MLYFRLIGISVIAVTNYIKLFYNNLFMTFFYCTILLAVTKLSENKIYPHM
jgi:hypothetical protein